MTPITVADLIEFLRKQPQDLPVAHYMHSEHFLMDFEDIKIVEACMPRENGWVQSKRPDMETQNYLVFPGH